MKTENCFKSHILAIISIFISLLNNPPSSLKYFLSFYVDIETFQLLNKKAAFNLVEVFYALLKRGQSMTISSPSIQSQAAFLCLSVLTSLFCNLLIASLQRFDLRKKRQTCRKNTKKSFFLNVCCVLVFQVFLYSSVCWFLYGPFCNGALKHDISTLFTKFFL